VTPEAIVHAFLIRICVCTAGTQLICISLYSTTIIISYCPVETYKSIFLFEMEGGRSIHKLIIIPSLLNS
jgi:hypothetical protein